MPHELLALTLQLRSTRGTARRFYVYLTEAVFALFFIRRGSFGFFLADGHDAVHQLDKQENHKSHDNEINNAGNESPVF
jgi:hypothetical protein